MKRRFMMMSVAVVAAAGMWIAAVPSGARGPVDAASRPDPRSDIGTGERLIVLIGGEYATREQAVVAEAAMGFHEIVGFLVARSDDFDGMSPGRFVLVTAFRTAAGAAQFQEVARAIGVRSIRRMVTTYRGRAWIGLGQEQRPDGSGPLIGRLPLLHPIRLP